MKIYISIIILIALIASLFGCGTTTSTTPSPARPEVILATTTSTADTGLLDALLPLFQQKTGYVVKPIAVGSGQAMTMGERGEADVLMVHAPSLEIPFMGAGYGVNRVLLMHNYFVIVGPASDPAGIGGMISSTEALKKIAAAKSIFLSRGDKSGTDTMDKNLWKAAGIDPKNPEQIWYQETGQGMGATLNIAAEKGGYTLTDYGTYLKLNKTLNLKVLVEGDPSLINIYHVIEVNPAKWATVNVEGAKAFSEFMLSAEVQNIIKTFGAEQYGQPFFIPDAGKTDAELGM